MRVLVVNAGSSSLKLSLIGPQDETLGEHELKAPRAELDSDAVHRALDSGLRDADAVGHRIVHGGERFRSPVRIEGDVRKELDGLVDQHRFTSQSRWLDSM